MSPSPTEIVILLISVVLLIIALMLIIKALMLIIKALSCMSKSNDIECVTIARNDIDKLLCDPEFDPETILHEALLYYLVELSKTRHGRQIIENNKILATHFGAKLLKPKTPNWPLLLGPKCPLGNTGPTGPAGSMGSATWSQRQWLTGLNKLDNTMQELRVATEEWKRRNHGHPQRPPL